MRPLRTPLAAATVTALLWGLLAVFDAGPALASPRQALPTVDVNYIAGQLVDMGSNYLMRYSGFDGPPGDLNPADGNQPPNVNGWQEFFQHWKEQMTSPSVMGKTFAPAINVSDHLFQPSLGGFVGANGAGNTPYMGDVRVATIPGQSCPGQVTLVAGHPDSTPGLNTSNGSVYDDTSGITMGMGELQAMTRWWTANHAWPARTMKVALFDAEEIGLQGSQYYADNLIPPGPQGKYVLVANMDQNGFEYPAYPEGTTTSTWTPGPWFTNINASPIKDFSIYGPNANTPPPAIKANMPAIVHFRQVLGQMVSEAFAKLGAKYHFTIPLDNATEGGRAVSAYTQADVAKYSPVRDDTLGRTDQVPFVALGIPGFGVLGAYDSNPQEDVVGGTPLSPLGDQGIFVQQAGYDTPRDNVVHFNFMSDGTFGSGQIAEGGRRALELPATWTSYLLARPEYTGSVARSTAPIAYYEALPTSVAPAQKVGFDASGSVSRGGGALRYYWDFGDGAHATGQKVSHAYSHAGWYDAVLTVVDSRGRVGGYRTGIKVGAAKTPPATNSCGLVAAAREAHTIKENGGKLPASLTHRRRGRHHTRKQRHHRHKQRRHMRKQRQHTRHRDVP